MNSTKINRSADGVIFDILIKGLVKVGLKADNVSDPMINLAIQELKKTHGGLSVKEVELAFDMAARDQLEFEANTYQNFSILYLNQLVNSYKRWALLTNKFLENRAPESRQIEYSPYIYSANSLNQIRGEIQAGLVSAKRGFIINPGYIPYEWYNFLVADKFLPAEINVPKNKKVKDLTSEEKENLIQAANIVLVFLVNRKEDLYVPE